MTSLFFKGMLIGFSIAMPVGPIGMLCIQHSLLRGLVAGFMAGLGAALADAIYGAIAAFGVGIVSNILENHFIWIESLGAIMLGYMGIHTLLSYTPKNKPVVEAQNYWRILLSTFLLTLTNPMTLLGFAGVYASFGICCGDEGIHNLIAITLGVLLGSAAWWLLLSLGVSLIGRRWQLQSRWLNLISGIVILTFGVLTAFDVLTRLI